MSNIQTSISDFILQVRRMNKQQIEHLLNDKNIKYTSQQRKILGKRLYYLQQKQLQLFNTQKRRQLQIIKAFDNMLQNYKYEEDDSLNNLVINQTEEQNHDQINENEEDDDEERTALDYYFVENNRITQQPVDNKYLDEVNSDELNKKLMNRMDSNIDIFIKKNRKKQFESPFLEGSGKDCLMYY